MASAARLGPPQSREFSAFHYRQARNYAHEPAVQAIPDRFLPPTPAATLTLKPAPVQAILERFGSRLRDLYHPAQTGLIKSKPPSWRLGPRAALAAHLRPSTAPRLPGGCRGGSSSLTLLPNPPTAPIDAARRGSPLG